MPLLSAPVRSMKLPPVVMAGSYEISLPAGRDGTKLTPITVTLAAYPSLAAARTDWDAFELAAKLPHSCGRWATGVSPHSFAHTHSHTVTRRRRRRRQP